MMLTLRLHPDDSVVIARGDLAPGTSIPGEGTTVREAVPLGHKLATRAIASGEPVRRYGQVIGFATRDIAPGEHVHTQNMGMGELEREYAFSTLAEATAYAEPPATFQGILRDNGQVATRNYIGLLTSVNCSATVAGYIADAFKRRPFSDDGPLAGYPNVDGVVALTHKTGCGMASDGEGMDVLRRTIAGYARHPNFAAVIMVGLGCETNQLAQRQTLPASHITVGLQCGGSDGYSGITANPALGAASDLLVGNGGAVILSETPETYGAEHLLTRRAVSRDVGEKLLRLFDWWKDYTARSGGQFDNNPSFGNKAGGITTIIEKSLGAVAKAGSTRLVDVYRYADPVSSRGFVFMDTPGFDPVSATGQVAGGANLVCFTTGRGSVFGCVPAPSLKLATNTPLYLRMTDDMDVNCGGIADGEETVEACGRRVFDLILRVASGEKSKSEALGFGEAEFAPWTLGAVM
jgi:altronate hydrolase